MNDLKLTKAKSIIKNISSSLISRSISLILLISISLSLLVEVATYKYSFTLGIRVPIEGVPYIEKLVFYSSAIILTSFYFINFVYSFIYDITFFGIKKDDDQKDIKNNQYSKISFKILMIVFLFSLSYIILYYAYKLLSISFNDFEKTISFRNFLFFAIIIHYIPSIINLFFRKYIIAYSFFISFIYVFYITLIFFFNHNAFSDFLNKIGYGGGLNIELSSKNNNYTDTELVLRTNNFTILKIDNHYVEIPNDEIIKITYKENESKFMLHKILFNGISKN